MTDTEDKARAALRASKTVNDAQQALTDESRILLAGLLRSEMRLAVSEGIADAMTDENAERFWMRGLSVLQTQAANQAGLFVLSGLKKAVGIAVIVLAVYFLGGWGAAKSVLGAFTKG